MSDKFQNRYRIPSARRPDWDYKWSANYFITICTQNKEHFFGEITNGQMKLSDIGRIVETEWLRTPGIRPDMNLHLGAFVIMPNHFHAIITIGDNQFNHYDGRDAMHRVSSITHNENAMSNGDAKHRVSTTPNGASPEYKNEFIPQSKNLSSIIRGFKSAVTLQARAIHADFAWQTRFHDHIIRNTEAHDTIQRYILNNPMNWEDDSLHTQPTP